MNFQALCTYFKKLKKRFGIIPVGNFTFYKPAELHWYFQVIPRNLLGATYDTVQKQSCLIMYY